MIDRAPLAAQLSVAAAPLRGIALVVCAGVLFTVSDTIIKWLRTDFSVGQAICVRGLFTLGFLVLFAHFAGGLRTLRVRHWRSQLLRAALVLLTSVSFTTAIRYLPLADVVGAVFAGPLFSVALAGPLLGERIGWRRWSATLIGFVGILFMVRPGANEFQWVALLPLITALGGALRDILTRRMSLSDHSNATLGVSTLAVVVAGSVTWPLGIEGLLPVWIAPQSQHLLLFALSGLLMGAGQYCLIESLRVAEVGLVVPFKYMSYVWAVLLGFVLWRDVPSASSIGGVSLVIGSGLFIFWREQRLIRERTRSSRK